VVDSRTGFSPQRAGNEVSAVQMQILELWGDGAGVLRGPFCLKDGRRVEGHRGLSVSGASRESKNTVLVLEEFTDRKGHSPML